MAIAILIAQIVKIGAGLAQLALACWILVHRPKAAAKTAFGISIGANGIAYAIFNLALPENRTQGAAQYHLTALEFGAASIYAATAFVLGALPIAFHFNPEARPTCAFLAAALAINSADHLGAELVQPGHGPEASVLLQIAAMIVVLSLWLWNLRTSGQADSRLALLVVVCLVAPFVAGAAVCIALGSYRGVQQSGLIGIGRLVGVGLLVYGMLEKDVLGDMQ